MQTPGAPNNRSGSLPVQVFLKGHVHQGIRQTRARHRHLLQRVQAAGIQEKAPCSPCSLCLCRDAGACIPPANHHQKSSQACLKTRLKGAATEFGNSIIPIQCKKNPESSQKGHVSCWIPELTRTVAPGVMLGPCLLSYTVFWFGGGKSRDAKESRDLLQKQTLREVWMEGFPAPAY